MSEPECLLIFVDGLKKSAGAAHAMGHYQENPNWLKVRDLLENLIVQGQKMAISKSMPRSEVLLNLEAREKAARLDS
jgi:hypothetical protein